MFTLHQNKCNMNKSKKKKTNAAIEKAVKLYFKGKTTECFDLLDSLTPNPVNGQQWSRLKKNLAVAAPRRVVRTAHAEPNLGC
jgi:GrpB-like predicted nucleotidyltransferase (UPF0157 family)